MAILDLFNGRDEKKAPATETAVPSKDENDVRSRESESDLESNAAAPTQEYQAGVQKNEAVALVWGKWSLVGAYVGIYLVFYMNSLQQQITGNLTSYVYSDFMMHSLVTTTSIMSGIIGGVLKLPIAKMIDLWGRTEGYIVMVGICTLGLILMAACNNVETYAAAQVFYWVGYNGISYILDVFIADTSSLRNRALMFSFTTTPYIANAFAGPAAAQSFYETSGWRWAFGCFAIVMPVVSVPISVIFMINQRKAIKLGLIKREPSGRTVMKSILHYCVEFDVIGAILLCAAFVLFLLPFNLAGYQSGKWQSANIIAMITVGGVLFFVFAAYEKFYAPKPFIPFHLLKDRTVLGACILAATVFISFYCWDGYFYSYAQVVYGLSLSEAGYLLNTYSIGSCFWGVVFGLYVRQTNHFKNACLYFGVPLMILGAGLMIHFRQPDVNIGYVVMCQIFIAFAGGTLVIGQEMAVMAAAEHQEVAVLLALLGLFSSVGGAIGSSVSGAIWTNTLPGELERALPDSVKAEWATIYASLTTQLSYPRGSAERDAIIYAYGVAQKRMCIAACCVLILAIGAVAVWRDYDVSKRRQVKGRVI